MQRVKLRPIVSGIDDSIFVMLLLRGGFCYSSIASETPGGGRGGGESLVRPSRSDPNKPACFLKLVIFFFFFFFYQPGTRKWNSDETAAYRSKKALLRVHRAKLISGVLSGCNLSSPCRCVN